MTNLKYRKSTYYEVQFPTAPSLKAKPDRVELTQKQYEHDLLVLNYGKSSSLWFSILKTGTPIIFTWVQNNEKSIWVGYVINVSKTNAAERGRPMKVYCVGASYVLKARGARVFKNVSVTDVARKVAKEFGLGFVGENSSRKFSQIVMTGQSYWQFLQEQAARIGYGLYVRGATLYMRPLDRIINAGMSYASTLTLQPPVFPAGVQAADRTLDRFEILNGDLIENGDNPNTVKVTAGVNPLTNKPVGGSQDPKKVGQKLRAKPNSALFSDYPKEVVHGSKISKQAAKDLAEGARFTVPAKLVGQGDRRAMPYNVFYIEGTGFDTDGYWLIKEVEHVMLLTGQYQIDVKVVTDGIGSNVQTAFRGARPSRVGTINVQEKILQDLSGGKNRASAPKLTNKVPRMLETQQGFAQLNSVWSGK